MTIFHHKLLTREEMVLANGWTHPSSMTIFVNLFTRNFIPKVTILTLNAIWHEVSYLVSYAVHRSHWQGIVDVQWSDQVVPENGTENKSSCPIMLLNFFMMRESFDCLALRWWNASFYLEELCLCIAFFSGLKGVKNSNIYGDCEKHVLKYMGSDNNGKSHHYFGCHLSRTTKLHKAWH